MLERPPNSDIGSVFVGRQREMTELRSALDSAIAGQGRIVMLAGEPGIGKTRTATELANRARSQGANVMWGWCYEGEGAPPYWPWIQSIRSYVREATPDRLQTEMGNGAADIAALLTEVHEKLPVLPPLPPLDPGEARFRLFDSLATFFKNASASCPLLIVLEDLHWSDPSSLMLWEFISKEISTSKVMLLGTYRDIEVGRGHPLSQTLGTLIREPNFRRVALGGLSRQDAGRFVELSGGVSLTASTLELIHNRTEGNPLFLNELVRLLDEEGMEATDSWATSLPEGIKDAIGRRLDNLSEQCNDILTIASVIGREFVLDQLKLLSDQLSEDTLLEVLEEALSSRVIEEIPQIIGHYQFTHALIQETLAEELSPTRRVRLHARIAEALEGLYGDDAEDHAAELAHHFAEAQRLTGPDKLVNYTLVAGERALSYYAYEDALAHFEVGLAAMADRPMDAEKAALHFGIGRAQAVLQLQESASSLRVAFDYYMKVSDLEKVVAVAEYGDYGTGVRMAGIREVIRLALETVPTDSHYAGRLLCRYGQAIGLQEGNYEDARNALEQALLIARREGDPALEMNVLSAAASVDGFHSRYDSQLINCLNAIRLSDQVNDPRSLLQAHYFAASVRMITGELEQARLHAAAMVEPSERLRDRFWVEGTRWKCASVARLAGDWDEVRRICTSGIDVSIRRHPLLMELALIEHESGDSLQGDSYLQRLLEITQLGTDFGYGNLVATIVAWITNRFEQLTAVKSLAENRIASPTAPPASKELAQFGLAMISIMKNESIDASRYYRTFVDRRGTMVNWTFSTDRLLGLLCRATDDLGQAAEHFEDALIFCRKAGYRPELAWSCCDYADTLQGDRSKILSLLDESLAISTELGMRPLMERVTERLGQIHNRSEPTPANPDGLTHREVEVLRLIAAGKTDREIAEDLFIGVRTVSTHVSNILNKINAANRTEAASYANHQGLV